MKRLFNLECPTGGFTAVLTHMRVSVLITSLTFAGFSTSCVSHNQQYSATTANLRLKMLTAVLNDIDHVYLHDRNISHLSIAAIEGLKQIEPGLSITQYDKTITAKISTVTIISDEMPSTPSGWADFIVQFLNRAEPFSYALEKASDEQLFSAIFNSITLKLDSHSRYASAKQAAKNRIKRRGFGGIGIEVKLNVRGAKIVKTYKQSPAAEAGLKAGDVIISIGNNEISGMSLDKIRRLIEGPINVPVSLRIYKNENTPAKRYLLDRTRIIRKTVYATYNQGIGVFRISRFNKDTTSSLKREIKKARRNYGKKMQGVVIDIRDNPGGLLDQAVDVADLFLNKGPIIATRGRHKNSIQKFKATPGDIIAGLPLAILMNGATASAAEILAAALQDNGRAVLVGSSSFGKGTVQTVLRLPNDGEIILTWARIEAPSGYALQTLGVVPTICTVGKLNASAIVNQFQKVEFKRSRKQLHLRRNADFKNAKQRDHIKKFCRWQPDINVTPDRLVAELILKGQGRYAQATNLARIPPGS